MAGTLKDISDNYEKLHRLEMIETLLRTSSKYVTDIVTRVQDDFDDCEPFEDTITETVITQINQAINTLKMYL